MWWSGWDFQAERIVIGNYTSLLSTIISYLAQLTGLLWCMDAPIYYVFHTELSEM